MRFSGWGIGAGAALLAGGIFLPSRNSVASAPTPPPSFTSAVVPVITKYCLPCHSGSDAEAGLALDKLIKTGVASDNWDVWVKVMQNLETKHMPPKGSPTPSATAAAHMMEMLQKLSPLKSGDVGHVTLRRLNRAEYDNTIRDLTGLKLKLSEDFPSDDVGYGFDNIGDVLSMSPLLMEKYINAAETVSEKLIPIAPSSFQHVDGVDMTDGTASAPTGAAQRELYSNCTVHAKFTAKSAGRYHLKIQAHGQLAGPELPRMVVDVDGQRKEIFNVGNTEDKIFEIPVDLSAGDHVAGFSYTNDYYDGVKKEDRNLIVGFAELNGPDAGIASNSSDLMAQPAPSSKTEWDTEATKRIRHFASLAYRRPITAPETARLLKAFDTMSAATSNFQQGMRLVVQAVLVSPNFLFRVELDPRDASGKPRPLNDYELASRLSYFLWCSMPDAELVDLAEQKTLHKPEVLRAQVARMLQDPKAAALADNFATQWLQLRKLAIFFPDKKQFPDMTDKMKEDMAKETTLFFDEVVQKDRSVIDFLDGRYTFLDERLAKHYGIDGITGPQFRKVDLEDPNRGGILTQASVLSVTSNPTRTSPTKRGKWVLDEILGAPPPPPPPGVSTISNEKAALSATTLRKLMEEHRKNPACAACHAKMDPIGFGMENFDPVGRWRTKEGNFPVDATGVLPDGQKFDGPVPLRTILLGQKKEFVRCFSEKLMTYALGRGVVASDGPVLDHIVKKAETMGYKFTALTQAIVTSSSFLKQGRG